MNELEAKYLVASGKKPLRVLRRVLQELSWSGYLAHPRGAKDFVDEYFDTADWQLRKAGWTYRLRHSGSELTATLKQLASQRSNIFERQEIEQELTAAPGANALPPTGPVAELLLETLGPNGALQRLFSQRTHRRCYHLTHPEHPHAHIELALDQVEIEAQPPLRYAEVEFELHEGPVNALQDLAGVMQQQPYLIPARVGKYERGVVATGPTPPTSEVWQSAKRDIYGKWIEVALPHLNRQRLRLKQQEPFAWEAVHIEGVHQMRVTTRRIRAGLRTFANVLPKKSTRVLVDDVRWLTQALGEVRDLDVQLENLRSYRELLSPAQRPALNRYQRHLEKDHRHAHMNLINALSSERFAELDAHFEKVLAKATRRASTQWGVSIQQAASDQVLPLLEGVLRKGRRIKKSSPPEKLHRLRIAVKRLRYQLEYLLDAYGKPARRAYKALGNLQNVLGAHQDAMVALERLESYCQHTNLDRVERRMFGLLMAQEQENAQTFRAQFLERWRRFEKTAWQLQKVL